VKPVEKRDPHRTSQEVVPPAHLDDGAVGPLGLEEEHDLGEPRLQREVDGVHEQRSREPAQLVPQQRLVVSAPERHRKRSSQATTVPVGSEGRDAAGRGHSQREAGAEGVPHQDVEPGPEHEGGRQRGGALQRLQLGHGHAGPEPAAAGRGRGRWGVLDVERPARRLRIRVHAPLPEEARARGPHLRGGPVRVAALGLGMHMPQFAPRASKARIAPSAHVVDSRGAGDLEKAARQGVWGRCVRLPERDGDGTTMVWLIWRVRFGSGRGGLDAALAGAGVGDDDGLSLVVAGLD
jgi:hypothetical protein